MPAEPKHSVETGRWLSYGFLSGQFYVFTRRRAVKVHDDGRATFEIIGAKSEVDLDSVLNAVKQREEWLAGAEPDHAPPTPAKHAADLRNGGDGAF